MNHRPRGVITYVGSNEESLVMKKGRGGKGGDCSRESRSREGAKLERNNATRQTSNGNAAFEEGDSMQRNFSFCQVIEMLGHNFGSAYGRAGGARVEKEPRAQRNSRRTNLRFLPHHDTYSAGRDDTLRGEEWDQGTHHENEDIRIDSEWIECEKEQST